MEKRRLGKSELEVSALGLGCMGMSEFYGTPNDDESVRTIQRALEMGLDFFDTADMYGKGENEILLGKALKGFRDKAVLATKFGIVRTEDIRQHKINGRPKYIRSACEASLRRLGVETIDLYYQHRVDQDTPIEETVGAMAKLVQEGKVRYLGLSEAGPQTIRRAHAVHPIAALQTEYSLWSRDVEDEILSTCRDLGIGLVPYSPLGRGFLTGQIKRLDDLPENDWRRHSPRFQKDNWEHNWRLVKGIREIAEEKGCTPSQLALAWVLAQGADIIPIPGTKRRSYLEENMSALDLRLTQEDLQRIEKIAPRDVAAGSRYPEAGMRLVDL